MKEEKEIRDLWNKLHCMYVAEEMKDCITWSENGYSYSKPRPEMVGYRNRKMIDFCVKSILAAKEAYYNTGEPIINDDAYDYLENNLKALDPTNKALEKVGTDIE